MEDTPAKDTLAKDTPGRLRLTKKPIESLPQINSPHGASQIVLFEVVAAGAVDSFQIFLWSLNSGRLLEVLAGHEGPVSALHFNGTSNQLASTAWDATLRVWEVFEGKGRAEVFQLPSEGAPIFLRSVDSMKIDVL